MKDTHETIQVNADSHGEYAEAGLPGFLTPDVTLLFSTWVCFFVLLAVLSKYAWKPILKALDDREAHLKESVDNAERIKEEMTLVAEKSEKILASAKDEAKVIIDEGRKAGQEASKIIESKARGEAQILIENATRDIKDATEKAKMSLREESTRIAVSLSEKILSEKLDESHNQKIINRIIKDLN